MSWLDDLEARLEQELERFLAANPDQEALLQDQQDRDHRRELLSQRRSLQSQAERQRQALLQLAVEIRQWQERSRKARSAGADDLADRAEAHGESLMQQGRRRWQELAELGVRFSEVEQAITALAARQAEARRAGRGVDLERDWAAFEAEQELERLRRRQG
jgi:hercynine metabolism protein